MAWDVEDLKIDALQENGERFLDEKIGFDGFDFPAEPQALEKKWIDEHLLAVAMIPDLAAVFALDPRGIDDMIDVAMSQEQKLHLMPVFLEPLGRVLRRIHQNTRGSIEKAVRIENTAGESIQLHGKALEWGYRCGFARLGVGVSQGGDCLSSAIKLAKASGVGGSV